MNVVEDEKHFLFDCDLQDDIRQVFFANVNTDDFSDIMNNTDSQFHLAKCIVKMFEKRKSIAQLFITLVYIQS